MSEKVKLPREVGEAISHFFTTTNRIDFPVQAIMKVAMEDVRYISSPDHCDAIKEYVKSYDNLKVLLSALVNGYEVEETPEEKIKKYYENHAMKYDSAMAIRHVLDILNIKIEGVNA